MLVAQEKRKVNIAEYILYMWQVEDLLRALKFDLDQIGKMLVSRFDVNEDTRLEIYDWYKNLSVMMEKEQVTQTGHVQFLVNLLNDLHQFHIRLLNSSKDPKYAMLYQLAQPIISEFKAKSNGEGVTDIQLGFQSLYSIILLKLQKKEISSETKTAVGHITKLLGHLSARYLQYENGKFDI